MKLCVLKSNQNKPTRFSRKKLITNFIHSFNNNGHANVKLRHIQKIVAYMCLNEYNKKAAETEDEVSKCICAI